MFGYVTVNKDELKIKDYKRYQSYYCGICQELKERHGMVSRMTLTYDMTFLAVLLAGLYEEHEQEEEHRCLLHPVRKHSCIRSEFTQYAADMNLMLCYYNLLDDWYDEKKAAQFTLSRMIRSSFLKVSEAYPRQAAAVRRYMKRLKECEQADNRQLDLAAGYTGELFGEIFVYRQDAWKQIMQCIGFYIGKFIYLMDAYDDIEKDIEKNQYNPWKSLYREENFRQTASEILTMMVAECCKSFEKLPILENVDILRNILYSGIWMKYELIERKSEENK